MISRHSGLTSPYTLDGDTEGEIQYENFNAAKAEFRITGVNVHPGSSKDVMVNASLVAMEINSLLPAGETPRDTDGYEGFYHLTDMKGDVGEAVLRYITGIMTQTVLSRGKRLSAPSRNR